MSDMLVIKINSPPFVCGSVLIDNVVPGSIYSGHHTFRNACKYYWVPCYHVAMSCCYAKGSGTLAVLYKGVYT